MSVTVYFDNIKKRRNSTLQGTFSVSYSVDLKAGTSLDRPTFLISASTMDYNAAKWDNRYYFIDNVVSVRNNQWEVSCILDVLATYKADIIASTQYVCYSASATLQTWLTDERIPLLKNANVSANSASISIFSTTGFYVISVLGAAGCVTWGLTKSEVEALLQNVSQYSLDLKNDIINNLPFATPADETEALQNLVDALSTSGTLGNAYLDAPSCVRSGIWVPFYVGPFSGGLGPVYLGQYNTGITGAHFLKDGPATGSFSINIPWHYSDWRRTKCEEVYLYLPLVGMVNIPSDEVVNASSLSIEWSATASDGCIAYKVNAGSQVVGTYGGNCAANYPIGISQQASVGEIANSVISGVQKTVSAGVSAVSSSNPVGMVAGGVETALTGAVAAYDVANTMMTRHNSVVGGIGGGAGSGLNLNVVCFTVSHPTVVNPSDMALTMGVPVMKPMSLSGLSGFCKCANAHVEVAAQAREIDAIDSYLNSGFFIE